MTVHTVWSARPVGVPRIHALLLFREFREFLLFPCSQAEVGSTSPCLPCCLMCPKAFGMSLEAASLSAQEMMDCRYASMTLILFGHERWG